MKSKAGAVVSIAMTCIVMGAAIGALTNMVNGAVSPLYFKNIMRLHDVQDVWRASIVQGVLEGLIYGVVFAAVFATVVGIVTKADCPYLYVAKFILGISLAVLGCWAAAGVVAMGLATLSPEFYRRTFIGVPDSFGPMLRYAWVGGSICGSMVGGLSAAILGSVIFWNRWKKRLANKA